MQFSYHEAHLEGLQTMAREGAWPEVEISSWMQSSSSDGLSPAMAGRKLNRSELMEACACEHVTDRDMLWAVLAWGRMRRDAACRLKAHESDWIDLVGRLRRENLNRRESYLACSEIVKRLRGGGIGPAYFTKLIFFANPRHDGYIMDQWTSRSVNFLISDEPIVLMRTVDHVDPRNDDSRYEKFCSAIENLSLFLNRTPEKTEQCLFSKGGRNPDSWRRYLIENEGKFGSGQG